MKRGWMGWSVDRVKQFCVPRKHFAMMSLVCRLDRLTAARLHQKDGHFSCSLLSQKCSFKRLTGAGKIEMMLKRYGFEAFVCLQKLCLTLSKIRVCFHEKECNFDI